MLLAILLSAGFFVFDQNELPVPGAWIGSPGNWFGITDETGYYLVPENCPDSIHIHATGFHEWSGVLPPDNGSVHLHRKVLDTGAVINVFAYRGSLAAKIPSSETLSDQDLQTLGTVGMDKLNGRVPGVTVREYGGSMPVVSISIRGGDPSQTDVMVDGVSIVSARDGMPTGLFDPGIFSSLEVARGGAAGPEGSGSAGALNYLTPVNRPFSITASGFSSGAAGFTIKSGRTGFSLSRNVGSEETRGWASSLVTTGTWRSFTGGLLGGWASGDTESPDWTVQGDGRREQGQLEGWLNWKSQSFEGDLSLGGGRMEFQQTQPYLVDDTHDDCTGRFSVSWKGPATVRAGVTTANVSSTATGDHSLNHGVVELSGSHHIFRGALGFSIDEDLHVSGRLSAVQNLTLNDNPSDIFVSLFTDHRSPTVNDLYWPMDGQTSGNPDLESQQSTGLELGGSISSISGAVSASVTGFLTSTEKLILWLPDGSGIWRPSNVSSALSRGVEASLSGSWAPFKASCSFTYNLSEDRTEDTPRYGMLIPYRPEYSWGANLETDLPMDFSITANLYGMGKRFTNRTQTEYLDDYFVVDLVTGRDLSSTLRMDFLVSNLLDKEYQVTDGYPGRPRTFGAILEYSGE